MNETGTPVTGQMVDDGAATAPRLDGLGASPLFVLDPLPVGPAPTPRTDAKAPVTIYDCMGQEYTADLVPADLSRELEREGITLRKVITALESELAHWKIVARYNQATSGTNTPSELPDGRSERG